MQQPQRAGVASGRRGGAVDHERLAGEAAVLLAVEGFAPGLAVVAQRIAPALQEASAVRDLAGLHARAGIEPRRHPLEVDHLRGGLVDHAPARRARAEGEIHVLVVAGREGLVEAAERLEERPLHRERRPRHVVGLARVLHLGRVRRVPPPVVPARSVAPHDRARLPGPARGVEQLRAGHAGAGEGVEGREQRVEPAVGHDSVVVQEHQRGAARLARAAVAAAHEAQVPLVADQLQAGHLPEPLAVVEAG